MPASSREIPYPPRVNLARIPTPLEPLSRLGEKLGIELYMKRDDLTGTALTGNKVRKLEFVLADALECGADIVLTCGGAQSNHARATAIAATKLGLHSRLLLRTPDPSSPPPLEGNIMLDRLAGSEIVWITPDEYKRRNEIFEREASALRKSGRKPYIIPEGASNALGSWGYVRAAEELLQDLQGLSGGQADPFTIIHAAGSGGTAAGLIVGALLTGLNARIISVNVCDDRDYFLRAIGKICEDMIAAYRLDLDFSREKNISVVDGYVGRGYALSRPEELALIYDVARTEGIFLDPVYTGKAYFGMVQELERDRHCFGERVIFLHTGGIFGLLPKADEIAQIL